MIVYLDTSVLVSMFVADSNTPRAWRIAEQHQQLIHSLWTVAEFSSALGVQVRMDRLQPAERVRAEAQLDEWMARSAEPVPPAPEDFMAARQLLRTTSASLRTPDALHLAICKRIGAALASFDNRMQQAAAALGTATIHV